MNQYANQVFRENYQATIGSDFLTKQINVNGRRVTMQIVDTVGQERFRGSLGTQFYRGADACMLVFDMSNRDSFKSLSTWRDEFLFQAQGTNVRQTSLLDLSQVRAKDEPEPFPFAVLCNKADLVHDVAPEDIVSWCAANGSIPHYFTSAKAGTNVEKAFSEVARRVLALDENEEVVRIPGHLLPRDSVAIAGPPAEPRGGCC